MLAPYFFSPVSLQRKRMKEKGKLAAAPAPAQVPLHSLERLPGAQH